MTQQNKLIFFAIIGMALFGVITLSILETVGMFTLPIRVITEATITVAVPPILKSWVTTAANTFNQQDEKIQVNVVLSTVYDKTDKPDDGLDVWIVEADFTDYAVGKVPFPSDGDSVAQNSLMWVVDAELVDINWQTAHDMAKNDSRFNVALPPPGDVSRKAACLSAAAAYHQETNLTRELASDRKLQNWLDDIFRANPNPGKSPKEQLERRPPSVDVGLMLKHEANQLNQSNLIQLPPDYNVIVNYSYMIRTSLSESTHHQAVAEQFKQFLLSTTQQNQLTTIGLDSASTVPVGQPVQVNETAIRGLQWCWQ
jgi:hypothetical protein